MTVEKKTIPLPEVVSGERMTQAYQTCLSMCCFDD